MDQRWLLGLGLGVVLGVLLWHLDPLLGHPARIPTEVPSPFPGGATLGTLTLVPGIPLVALALAANATDDRRAAYAIALAAVLLWIATIDVRRRVIPNRLVYPLALVAVLAGSLLHGLGPTLLGLLTFGGVFLLLFLAGIVIYRHSGALGLGDVKLAAAVGLALGYPGALWALALTAALGALLALVVLAVRRDRAASIPYGPAICLGAILTLLVAPPG
jgi:leader peptidase (prepilin peptidase)/N-methyltransferase